MASSQWIQISTIVDWVLLLRPSRVLDIGAGFGKYGLLCREYLDVFEGRLHREQWQTRIDAVEPFSPCLNPVHRHIYDDVQCREAVGALRSMAADGYDLVLLVDVLEHLADDQAALLLRECQRVAAYTLVSTPTRFFHQDAQYGNPRQVHQSEWTPRRLREHGGTVVGEDAVSSIAVFAGPAARVPVGDYIKLRRRRRLAGRFPAAHRLLRSARALLRP